MAAALRKMMFGKFKELRRNDVKSGVNSCSFEHPSPVDLEDI